MQQDVAKHDTAPDRTGLQEYLISLLIRQSFFLPKQSQKSRHGLQDGSRSLGLFWKGKTSIIAKFYRTDLVICSHSTEGKTLSFSRINTVIQDSNMVHL